MIFRAAVFAALVLALGLSWALVPMLASARAGRRVNRLRQPQISLGAPTVLFFSGEHCTVCHYQQKPAIEGLRAVHAGLRVVVVDAAREPVLSRRFGVLSLPTTAVLAPDGTVGAVNYGFAPAHRLAAQISGLPTA